MRKIKILSAFTLMILCVGALCVGVFSLNQSDKTMDVGGTIIIPATKIGVVVEGFIGDVENGARVFSTEDVGFNQTSAWEIGANELTFSMEGVNTKEDVNPIVLTLRITNNSAMKLNAYFTESVGENAPIVTQKFYEGEDESTALVKATLTKDDEIAETDSNAETTDDVAVISITFDLLKLYEGVEAKSLGFSFVLNINEIVE